MGLWNVAKPHTQYGVECFIYYATEKIDWTFAVLPVWTFKKLVVQELLELHVQSFSFLNKTLTVIFGVAIFLSCFSAPWTGGLGDVAPATNP